MLNKKIIVVLGMHRSGTSVFTRSLKALDVDLGNNLMQPIASVNSKGFFEDLDIYQFNEYLLNKLACVWSSCLIPQENQLEILDNQTDIDTAIELLKNKLQNIQVFGFKDPRVSVLLPFWQKIFKLCNINVSYLIAIRNPLSVALSLQKRDQFSIKKGLFLWFEYILSSVQKTQNLNRVLVHYEELMSQPIETINTIAQKFNLPINNQELDKFTNDFLDDNLQHNHLTPEDLKSHACCVQSVYKFYKYLLSVNQPNNLFKFDLDNIINLFKIEINPYIDELKFQDILAMKINEISRIKISLISEVSNLENERIKLINLTEDHRKIIELGNKEIHDLHERIKSNATHISLLESNLRNMETSLSWRLTQPLRSVTKLIR